MSRKGMVWMTLVLLVMLFVGALAFDGKADPYTDTMISFVCRELDKMEAAIVRLEGQLGEAREDIAGLKGWIGAAAGVPLAGGGGIWAWQRRKNGKAKKA